MKFPRELLLSCLLAVCGAGRVEAQLLPAAPVVLGDGRVTLGGDFSAAFGSDDPGFFTYTDYRHSALRRIRAGISGVVDGGDHLAVLGELRFENSPRPHVLGLYARVRPWTSRAIELRAGLVPPTFGAFSRRTYAPDNPLIGQPLGYQYLTSLRSDALPAHADELLLMRGRGWLSHFSIGDESAAHGLPLAAAFRWDTGIQVHAASDFVSGTASVTTGSLAHPLFGDDNSGRQIAGRIAVRPAIGLIVGASASRGPFVSTEAARAAINDDGDRFTQTAWGADAEYSREYYLLRVETIVSRWRVPVVRAPLIDSPLQSTALSVEGRYKILPGLYAAARIDRLDFSTIAGTGGRTAWEAPVTRLEVGGGYSLQRNLLLKLSYQYNSREADYRQRAHLVASEVLFWF